jgi:hypothetical protein
MKIKFRKKIFLNIAIIVLIAFFTACSCKNHWENSEVIFFDNSKQNLNICCKGNSAFFYLKFLDSKQNQNKIFPENVKAVKSENCNFISLRFSENEFGFESYSFAKVLANYQTNLFLVDTRFIENKCNCVGKQSFSNGFFIVNDQAKLLVETNRFGKIININEIYLFIKNYHALKLPKEVKNVRELADFIKNINNLKM